MSDTQVLILGWSGCVVAFVIMMTEVHSLYKAIKRKKAEQCVTISQNLKS